MLISSCVCVCKFMSVYLFSKIHVELMRGGEQPTEKEKKKKDFLIFAFFLFLEIFVFRISHFILFFLVDKKLEKEHETYS